MTKMLRFTVTRKMPNRQDQHSYYSCQIEEANKIINANSEHTIKVLPTSFS